MNTDLSLGDEDAVVFCMRVDEFGIPVSGSVVGKCRCGGAVWVALSTLERVDGRLVLVCQRCVTPQEFKLMLSTTITPTMMAELFQHRRDHPDQWR